MSDLLSKYDSLNVAVTGAFGYIGSQLVKRLTFLGANVLKVSRQNVSIDERHSFIKSDLKNQIDAIKVIENVNVVFHLASNTSLADAEHHPIASLTEAIGPITNLCMAASKLSKPIRIVHASTATVYGYTPNLPVSESTLLAPISIYDLHKLFAEQTLNFYTTTRIIQGVNLRLSNVFGRSTSTHTVPSRGIINKLTTSALKGQPITTFGDGNQLRDFVHINDVVEAFCLAGIAEIDGPTDFNVGSGVGTMVHEAHRLIKETIFEATRQIVEISSVPFPIDGHPIELRDYVADFSLMNRTFGWQPHVSLKSGIEDLIDANVEKNWRYN